MIKTLIIDGYQTCIWTEKNALEASLKVALNEVLQIRDERTVKAFESSYKKTGQDFAKKMGADKPILMDDAILFKMVSDNVNARITMQKARYLADKRWNVFSEIIRLYQDTLPSLETLSKSFYLVLCVDGCARYELPIMRKLKLDVIFKEIFITDQFKKSKEKPETWKLILKKLGNKPEQVCVIDDRPKNILAASSIGLSTLRIKRGKYKQEPSLVVDPFEVSSLKEACLVLYDKNTYKPTQTR